MISNEHAKHLRTSVSHSNCSECRADTERRFVDSTPWRYQHAHAYLNYAIPLLKLIRNGETSVESRIWYRKFVSALHTRISQKVPAAGRKHCASYLERFRQFPRNIDESYLRRFAARGASCLD